MSEPVNPPLDKCTLCGAEANDHFPHCPKFSRNVTSDPNGFIDVENQTLHISSPESVEEKVPGSVDTDTAEPLPTQSSFPSSHTGRGNMKGKLWPARSRVAATGTIYFQGASEQPTSIQFNWHRWLTSDEQPYVRQLKVTEDEKPLECGWVEEASLVVIENREGDDRKVVPTEQERVDTNSRVVVLRSAGYEFLRVRPGETVMFEPCDVKTLSIKCKSKSAKITLTIYPN